MSFKNCIAGDRINADGTPDYDRLSAPERETLDLFDSLVDQYNRQMGPGPAQTKAAADAAQAARIEAIQRKRRTLLQAASLKKIRMDLETYTKGDNDLLGSAASALLEQDTTSRFPSVVQIRDAILRQSHSKMAEILTAFKRDLVGNTRQKATQKDLALEIFGRDTGNAAAKEMASAWAQVAEMLRQRFNAAGGAIPKRVDWGMPVSHNSVKVRSAGYEAWRAEIFDELDLARMTDERTGLPFTKESIEPVLLDIFKAIQTDGASRMQPSMVNRGRSVATRRTDHRFLAFKTPEGWLKYNQRFGNPQIFDVMMGHIDTMARDIALMERLGPNPAATVTYLKQTIRLDAQMRGGKGGIFKVEQREDIANRRANEIDGLYSMISGSNNSPVSGFVSYSMQGTRQILQSAQLGSASLAAVTDLNFQRMTRKFNGLPQVGTITQTIQALMAVRGSERAKLAIRLGLTAEAYTTMAAAQARYVGDVSGPEVTRRISDFVMRASLLSPWTNAGRWAFGMEFLGHLGDQVDKAFDQLDPALRGALERYQIGADRWDMMRATPLYDYNGATFLRPDDITARTDLDPRIAQDLADKLLIMVNTETNFAVPSTSERGRLMFTGEARPGTVSGEVLRSFAMYKNFPVTVLNTHVARGLNLKGGNKMQYLASFAITTTLMGALAMQMKEIAKGRDPINMNPTENPGFWGGAMLQGGGLGIFGDFFLAATNRYGGGLSETVAGPVVGAVQDTLGLTVGNAMQFFAGEDTNFGRELVRFAQRYTPGSSIWYARLAIERGIADQVSLMVDPEAPTRMRRLERRFESERGQQYWWRPGQLTPSRGPDFGAALGQ